MRRQKSTLSPIPRIRRAAATVRLLSAISIETNRRTGALLYSMERANTGAFLDSWGDYGLVQISIAKGELSKAQSVLSEAQKQYPASDPWLILMQAALEQAEWKREQGGKGTP